ncbi:hypothetical protein SAMN05421863_100517 [Nitrosomonas communis]|jgi:hypothetical protein|uniref:Uncharacterized protein n=2 Tax=Nitrosomonas communis TaxID=44574 RepID=A0A1I4KUP3_9PROT|nr:hypothetical protein SAMN05421863_100517 [Nitrosomonas communis]
MQQFLLARYMLIGITLWPHTTVANPALADYDHCLKASVQNSNQKHELRNQCEEASPDDNSNVITLPSDAVNKIKIAAGFGWGIFNGSIYNGNKDYAIERVIIKLIPSQIIGTSSEIPLETKEYRIDVTVLPLSKGALSMVLDSDGTQEFEWRLVNILGRKININ